LTLSLALTTLVFVMVGQTGAQVLPARTALIPTSLITQTYVIAATGPSTGGSPSVSLSGSLNETLQVLGGGLYAGDGGYISNVYINGYPPPPVDIVGSCFGPCNISGNAVANYNAVPLNIPILYNIADFEPGGIYAIEAGSAYHSFTSSQVFNGNPSPGLYYVDGSVTVRDVGYPDNLQNVSIVATGDIRIVGGVYVTTYDSRFPLLFTVSANISTGAIGSHNPDLDLTGDLYAPNGLISISGATGPLHGRVYARLVNLAASHLIITCPVCSFAAFTLSLQKSVTPTVNVPYHGVVTYTSILRNDDLISDTYALFTDTLPVGVTFGQWLEQPGGALQVGPAISWTGMLSASTGITFTFTATHTGSYGDTITNIATFSQAGYLGSAAATFTVQSISYTLALVTAGNGTGAVAANPIGPRYLAGTIVTLTAIPSITSQFTGWSGAVITTANPVTLTMNTDQSVTATYALKTFIITPTAGAHGSIMPSSPQVVDYGASATFTITPDSGYHLVDVGVDGVSQGPIGLYAFTNITADHTLSATFALNPLIVYTLMVNAAGNGSGAFMLNPPGPSYPAGAVVTLTAVPNIASRFIGWSGDVITRTNPLVLTMDNNKALTATFVTYRLYFPLVLR
jgi:hypothetical protein